MIEGKSEFFPYIIFSGDIYYVLMITDLQKARVFFGGCEEKARSKGKTLYDYLYSVYYEVNSGETIQDIFSNSVIHVVGNEELTGVAYYRFARDSSNVELLNP